MKLNNNYLLIRIAFFTKTVASLSFALIIVLSLQKLSISAKLIGSAFSLMPLIAIFLDIPMGVLADRFSYKSAALYASFFESLSTGAFIGSGIFPNLVYLGFILRGFSTALDSGAFRLLFLDVGAHHFQDEKIATKETSKEIQYLSRFASIAGVGIGLGLVSLSPYYALCFSFVFSIVSFLLVLKTKNEHVRNRKFHDFQQGFAVLKKGFSFSFSSLAIPILIYSIVEGFRTGTDSPAFTPYAKIALNGENWLWTLALISFAVRVPCNALCQKLNAHDDRLGFLTPLMFSLVGVSFAIMSQFPTPIIALSCIVLNFAAYSFRDYWFDVWQINTLGKGSEIPRATVMSAMSVLQNLSSFIGSQILARWSLLDNPPIIYLMCGVVILVGSLAIFAFQTSHQRAAFKLGQNS